MGKLSKGRADGRSVSAFAARTDVRSGEPSLSFPLFICCGLHGDVEGRVASAAHNSPNACLAVTRPFQPGFVWTLIYVDLLHFYHHLVHTSSGGGRRNL